MTVDNEKLPPSCPEAERGVLGCCLLNTGKTAVALKAGVNSRWFYDLRHIEIFNVLAGMARNGGGDSLVATLKLRELGKLDHIGGPAYLSELQDAVPSAENLEFYLPDLRAYFQRRQVVDVIAIDPTYKLLGVADENSATDITALLNMVDSVATTTGAAVVLAGHFAKGNASAKETIDRISGSGVFARDPDSLVVFTKHEEEGAFVVEMILRNLPPVAPFVVKWQYPLFVRENSLDPARLKQTGGRPALYNPEMLLECLGDQRLTSGEWEKLCKSKRGVSHGKFYELMNLLEDRGEVQKSKVDERWEKIRRKSRNPNNDKDQ
jgi:DnaB-like helicase N terminal domain/AAA domain